MLTSYVEKNTVFMHHRFLQCIYYQHQPEIQTSQGMTSIINGNHHTTVLKS